MSESQDQQMAAVLLRLELVSMGATQAWNPSGGQSGEPDDRVVSQVARHENPPHIRWRIIYERQATDAGREAVIADASKELEQWTRRVAPRIEGKSLVELILEDGEGWEPKIVAQRYGVDAAFVRRKRMTDKRDTEDGKKLPDRVEEALDRMEKAKELRRQGLSTRQIAEILACHQTQVMRWVRKSAA
jgi:hypothetical protein